MASAGLPALLPRIALLGGVEIVEAGDGVVCLEGWVAAPPGGKALVRLRDADGGHREIAVSPSDPLAARRPFRIVAAGPVPVQIELVAAGAATLLADLPPAGRLVPKGRFERADASGLAGWLVHPLRRREPAAQLRLDGLHTIDVPLDEDRPDVALEIGREGALFGFAVSIGEVVRRLRGVRPDLAPSDGRAHEVALLAGDTEVDRRTIRLDGRFLGEVQTARGPWLYGWIAEEGRPERNASVDLHVDGIRYDTRPARQRRRYLVRRKLATNGGGFAFELPTVRLADTATMTLTVRPEGSPLDLPGGPLTVEAPAATAPLPHGRLIADAPEVAVVVAVHNAPEDVARCLDALWRHTTAPARLVLIDDASTDARIAGVLARHASRPNVTILRNARNAGYTATINRGIAEAGRADVVLLNSDTVVTPGWLQGLRAAAYAAPGIGTVTPLSDNAGVFSVPEPNVANAPPPWFTHEDTARLIRQASAGLLPEVPTGNGFCLYLRRACLDAVGPFDEAAFPRGYGEENDLCLRAADAGFRHVMDDRTFIHHRRSASFGAEKAALLSNARGILDERYPDYRHRVRRFEEDGAVLAVRWRIRRALATAWRERERPLPRLLTVISTTTGGTPQTNRDLMRALCDRYETWVLRCDTRKLELSRHREGRDEVVLTHRLRGAVTASDHHSAEYDEVVGEWLVRLGFEMVHVRHIAWHGLGLTQVCRRHGVPVVFSFHDFYTACPTVKLLDETGTFCGGACTATPGPCLAELWPAEEVPALKHRYIHRWREAMGRMLEACDAFVATSPSTAAILRTSFPLLAERDVRVIPHGRDFEAMGAATADEGAPFRLLVPGNISAAKGAGRINALAALCAPQGIAFHILGEAGNVEPAPNVVLHGPYRREDFSRHVAEIGPHAGAVFSLWPETYCHTLTEMWACGLPVVGFDTGAVGERIARHGGGWLVDPAVPAEALAARLADISADREDRAARRREVETWQHGEGAHYGTEAMATAYDLLYREVIARRRAFGTADEPAAKVVLVPPVAEDPLSRIRRAVMARNDLERRFVFRSVASDFPFGAIDPGASDFGPAHAVLAQSGQVPDDALGGRLPVILDAVARDPSPDEAAGACVVLVQDAEKAARLTTAVRTPAAICPVRLDARRWAALDAAESWSGSRPYLLLIGGRDETSRLGRMLEATRLFALVEAAVVLGDPDLPMRIGACAPNYDLALIRGDPSEAPLANLARLACEASGLPAILADDADGAADDARSTSWFTTLARLAQSRDERLAWADRVRTESASGPARGTTIDEALAAAFDPMRGPPGGKGRGRKPARKVTPPGGPAPSY